MQIDRLINFIDEYAKDFLEDGTKSKIIKQLETGDSYLALEIMNAIDKQWIDRVKEIKTFYVFTDNERKNKNGEIVKKPYYKADYIDSANLNINKIPTLRRVAPRNFGVFNLDDGQNIDR